MDGFPAGVGQSCQLYLPSIPPSSDALGLAPVTLLEGYQGCCFGGLGYLLCFLTPMERISWEVVAVRQRQGAWSSVGGDRDRVAGCQQCHSACDRAEGYQGCSWGGWEQGCCLMHFPSSVGRIPWEMALLSLGEGAVRGTRCQGFSSVTLPTVQLVTAKLQPAAFRSRFPAPQLHFPTQSPVSEADVLLPGPALLVASPALPTHRAWLYLTTVARARG